MAEGPAIRFLPMEQLMELMEQNPSRIIPPADSPKSGSFFLPRAAFRA